jgi:hypothetical protein
VVAAVTLEAIVFGLAANEAMRHGAPAWRRGSQSSR